MAYSDWKGERSSIGDWLIIVFILFNVLLISNFLFGYIFISYRNTEVYKFFMSMVDTESDSSPSCRYDNDCDYPY